MPHRARVRAVVFHPLPPPTYTALTLTNTGACCTALRCSQGVTIRTEEEKPSIDAAAAGSDSPRRGTPGQREAEAEDQAAHGQVLFGQAGGGRMNGQLSMPSVTR